MYTTNKGWEKIFYFSTWLTQGSSFLVPRAYAVMHRMHHAFSDTVKDPHSPHFFKDIVQMMKHTGKIYESFVSGKNIPEREFTIGYLPVWLKLDRFGNSWITRVAFGLAYISVYIIFAPSMWWFLLLPLHFFMGPVQGAIVNWFGHKFGYRNYEIKDKSKNSTPFGFLLMGELFQNNHHKAKTNANFARRWFEFDMTFIIMRVMDKLHIIRLIPITV